MYGQGDVNQTKSFQTSSIEVIYLDNVCCNHLNHLNAGQIMHRPSTVVTSFSSQTSDNFGNHFPSPYSYMYMYLQNPYSEFICFELPVMSSF